MRKKIHEKLKNLHHQKTIIEDEIRKLEQELQKLDYSNVELSKDEKIELFKTLFFVREDIFAKKWISSDGSKQNFYAVTQTFKGNDFLPLTNKDIELHLRGQIELATYILNENNQCKYVIFEILKDDVQKVYSYLKNLNIDASFEITSYDSIFVWIFFEELLEAKTARKFAQSILRKLRISAKIYPTADFANNSRFSDIIELPLHFKLREQKKSLFFDPDRKKIYKNQWFYLLNINKIDIKKVDEIIKFDEVIINNALFEDIEMPRFLLDIKLYDYIYIPTKSLSASFINKLKGFASFDNPQIKVLLSLRKPLYNTPKIIKSFEEDERYLKLPRGLIYQVKSFFDENNLSYKIDDKTHLENIETKKVKFELRDEQNEAILNICKNNFSICVAPPGFGKTLIGAKMFEIRACKTLIIVNKNMLLNQWCDRFVDYFGYSKKDIGYLGKGKNKLNGNIDVATMQSLKNNPELINNYSFVIVDECHHIPAITFELIVKQFFGRYVLGLSATPNRKDGLQPILFQQLGEIAYEYKKKRVYNNKLEVIRTEFISEADNYATLINDLCLDENRNNIIIEQIKLHKNRKILVLTDRIEHINLLEEKLNNFDINYVSIHGSLNKKEQNLRMKRVSTSSLIVATTSYFGEGIDFPHLNTIIFATPISYYGRLVQYLGRIGRGDQECLAIDLLDYKNAMLNSAYKKRLEGYKQMHYI